MAPILPGLTDATASIEAVAAVAAEHGATSFGASGLRLAPYVKEHYFGFLGAAYPDLLPRYQDAYRGAYAPREYLARLDERVARIRARHGFDQDAMRKQDLVPQAPPAGLPSSARGENQLVLPW
jgi:DNA repair photolyase